MTKEERITAIEKLGDFLRDYLERDPMDATIVDFTKVINKAYVLNPWFTKENIRHNLGHWAHLLQKGTLQNWLGKYSNLETSNRIGIVAAGNIPMVGFHDILCVLITGNHCQIKLSSKDEVLIEAILEKLVEIEPRFKAYISITSNLKGFDAVIATGGDNASRYFEYYFGKYPNIIRGNRKSVAILTGKESATEMEALADDIFLYYGLGCRNVSKLFLPKDYDLEKFYPFMEKYAEVIHHNKYANNYEYNRAVYLVAKKPHFDNGFLILKEDEGMHAPVGVIFYEWYDDIDQVNNKLLAQSESLQCVIGNQKDLIAFGQSQQPELDQYADNIDVIKFLESIA